MHLASKRLSLRNERRRRWNKSELPSLTLLRAPQRVSHLPNFLTPPVRHVLTPNTTAAPPPCICSLLLLLRLPRTDGGEAVKPVNTTEIRTQRIDLTYFKLNLLPVVMLISRSLGGPTFESICASARVLVVIAKSAAICRRRWERPRLSRS